MLTTAPQIRRAVVAAIAVGALALSSSAADTVSFLRAAKKDSFCSDNGYDCAVRINGIADDLVFQPQGSLAERANGTASITGFLESPLHPELQFLMQLSLSGATATGNPVTTLAPEAYAANGGPVDTSTWRYYPTFTGRIDGVGSLKGLKISVSGSNLQIGSGANGMGVEIGVFGTFGGNVTAQPTNGPTFPGTVEGEIAFGTDGETDLCTEDGIADSSAVWATDHAFILLSNLGDFQMIGPGQFKEFANGTGVMAATIVKETDALKAFQVSLDLNGRVDFGDANYPPPGNPKKELSPSAYVQNGGVIDTNTWHYYTDISGSFVGTGGYQGAIIDFVGTGPALQVGFGANGKNTGYGVSSWLSFTSVTMPDSGEVFLGTFDGDLNLDLNTDCEDWPTAAPGNSSALYPTTHAFTLFGIAYDFVFQSDAGQFIEYGDGTARMTGVIVRQANACESFAVELNFDNRVNPGDANYPPQGSPKKELVATAYISQGGPINPATWHYYETVNGTFTGLGCYAGALISATRMGPAFQVGFGANGKNFNYGGSTWLDNTVITQPIDTHYQLPLQFQSDCNVDLDGDCPGAEAAFGAGCPGTGHFVPQLNLLGFADAGNQVAIELTDAMGAAPWFLVIGQDKAVSPLSSINGCFSNIGSLLTIIPGSPLSGFGAGTGNVMIPRTIPAVASPLSFTAEAWIYDVGAMGHFSVSNGIEVLVK